MSRWHPFASDSRTPRGGPGLSHIFCRYARVRDDEPPRSLSLADCLVERPRPWLLAIWEPLLTKAPSPALAQPWCCYMQTVIFYHRPYVHQLRKSWWRAKDGSLNLSRRGFEEWDQIETRLGWNDVVAFEGEAFEVQGGRVIWAAAPGQGRRWWMEHGARRRPCP